MTTQKWSLEEEEEAYERGCYIRDTANLTLFFWLNGNLVITFNEINLNCV
jgi:hypothetical protein